VESLFGGMEFHQMFTKTISQEQCGETRMIHAKIVRKLFASMEEILIIF
jgi:hypothetical protein